MPRPPEHVRCKNFGCNKRSTQHEKLILLHLVAEFRFVYVCVFLYLPSQPAMQMNQKHKNFEFRNQKPKEKFVGVPVGTLIRDIRSKRSNLELHRISSFLSCASANHLTHL